MTRRWAVRLVAVPAVGMGLAGALAAAGLQAASPSAYAVTTTGAGDIPAGYLSAYEQAAAGCPGLAWPLLAAVGKVESDHGRAPDLVSSTGAMGPMQFMPGTWAGYGVDADGDGHADPFTAADAITAAADYLCALGVATDPHDALIAYNCGNPGPACQAVSAGYAATVLAWADRYGTPLAGLTGPAVAVAVAAALDQVGTPYLWGGAEPGGFDCSGLVQWAYAHAGVVLPRVAQAQYDAGPRLPAGTPLAAGDLLFFGADPHAVAHVGLYLGDGRMVDAPHTGALVRIDEVRGRRLVGATRPGGLP